ncbi:hypothetical protein M9H77_32886 [Catharanthus roseus]|uniref:Uncharacterized protein n=1 Tax=Catharanthus roseus TaxID=4058 RepID=A0ACC0A512_CATRO|nr:hypothetical protein M9H77_32886 [Catharanthus roseus]
MAEAILSFLLNRLSTFLDQEYAHLRGLREGLQFINDELGSMKAFLRVVESQIEQNNDLLQEWVKQVREAAYDIEDVIDEYMLIFAPSRVNEFYGCVQNTCTSVMTLKARHELSNKVNDIKSRVENISARYHRYKLEFDFHVTESNSFAAEENQVNHIRQRALLLEEADLVGIDVRKNELLSQILDDNSHLKVVSVLGMGGMGKTTLIRRVYEDTSVRRQFQIRAWVTVSQTFRIKPILMDLIQQLHKEIKQSVPPEVQSKDVDGLKLFLKDFLQEKRYVIVIDDIWSIDAWKALIYALPDCNCGSRIMVTTRIKDVAIASHHEHCGYVYIMKPLSDEESWTLFCNTTFEDKCCPMHLQDVSNRILKKCEGLPLAIASIGGVLFLKDKNRIDEWEKIYENLTGESEGLGKMDRLNKILLLSYNDLPYYLKSCLLYTSIYPEDYAIDSWKLIQLWTAEGFVQDREGMLSIEAGYEYINELVNRSLLQVSKRYPNGSIKGFRIHDIVREIILSEAKELGIITLVKRRYAEGSSTSTRRLVIQDFSNETQEDIQYKHLRSLLIFKYGDHTSTSSLLKSLCGRSNLLKVLNLNQLPLEKIPKEVFKLFHLKYLSLISSKVKVIPKFIKNLLNLEFLNLAETQVTKLPREILKLRKLRELLIYQSGNYFNNYAVSGFKAPKDIGRLLFLEVMYTIDADNEKLVKEIGKLSKLRELGITKLRREDGKELCCSLEKLTNLEDLRVWSLNKDEILDLQYSTIPQSLNVLLLNGRLEQVPQWVPSLQGLRKLVLMSSGLVEDQLECLQMLPNLLKFALWEDDELENLCFKAGSFQKLKKLCLGKLIRLRSLTIEEGAMPHLEKLELTGCELMEELPEGIENLKQLQEVELYLMPDKLTAEMTLEKENSRNCRKITRVPPILIVNWRYGKWEEHHL